jgi:hypothetical protein
MTGPTKRFLPLVLVLLAAAAGHADAALDVMACAQGRSNLPSGAILEASSRLAAARSQPGEQQLVLADALTRLALLSGRQSGSPDIAADGNPAPSELLRQALAIWNAAPPSTALARALQAHGQEFFNSQQCLLSREVLESALRLSSAAAGPNDAVSVSISQDLLRIGLAQRDEALVRRLAPTAKGALDARTQPLDPQDEQTVLALADFYYRQPDDKDKQELQMAEQLAQRGLALTTAGTATSARRQLSYRLASIYYAQLRYAEGEALRAQLAGNGPDPFARKDAFGRQREELIALVRKGDLKTAAGMGMGMVDRHAQALDASRRALAEAELARAGLLENKTQAGPAEEQAQVQRNIAQAERAVGQARARRNAAVISLAQVRSYLAEILHAMGNLDSAAAAYESALAGFEEAQSKGWQDRSRTRSSLAILYRTRGDAARALTLQQQVLDELLPLLGEAHPDVQEARAEIALLRKMQKP